MGLSLACGAASLVNPYGIRLHLHIAQFLNSPWLKKIVIEYWPPRFDNEATWLGQYLPIFVSAGIGGIVALYYVLLVMAPFYNLLYQLSAP